MSLPEFVQSIRGAIDLMAPRVSADSPALDAADAQRALEFADLWLTPAIVRDFDERDFVSRPPAERTRLADAVRRFRAVADAVPDTGPATREQVEAARAPFGEIVGLLQPYLADPEAEAVRHAVWRGWYPYRDWIPTFDYQLTDDHDGDPIARIWLILPDDADIESDALHRRLAEVRRAIADSFDRDGVARYPLVLVRLRSEVRGLLAGVVS